MLMSFNMEFQFLFIFYYSVSCSDHNVMSYNTIVKLLCSTTTFFIQNATYHLTSPAHFVTHTNHSLICSLLVITLTCNY